MEIGESVAFPQRIDGEAVPALHCQRGPAGWRCGLRGWDAAPPGPRLAAEMFGPGRWPTRPPALSNLPYCLRASANDSCKPDSRNSVPRGDRGPRHPQSAKHHLNGRGRQQLARRAVRWLTKSGASRT